MKKIRQYLPESSLSSLVKFTAVGAIGFVIDATVLMVLFHNFNFGHYSARIVSFSMAVTVTWYLNRNFTFRQYLAGDCRGEFKRYIFIQIIGSIINLTIYIVLITSSITLSTYPVIPLFCGSSIALIFNFMGSHYFVFIKNKAIKNDF